MHSYNVVNITSHTKILRIVGVHVYSAKVVVDGFLDLDRRLALTVLHVPSTLGGSRIVGITGRFGCMVIAQMLPLTVDPDPGFVLATASVEAHTLELARTTSALIDVLLANGLEGKVSLAIVELVLIQVITGLALWRGAVHDEMMELHGPPLDARIGFDVPVRVNVPVGAVLGDERDHVRIHQDLFAGSTLPRGEDVRKLSVDGRAIGKHAACDGVHLLDLSLIDEPVPSHPTTNAVMIQRTCQAHQPGEYLREASPSPACLDLYAALRFGSP